MSWLSLFQRQDKQLFFVLLDCVTKGLDCWLNKRSNLCPLVGQPWALHCANTLSQKPFCISILVCRHGQMKRWYRWGVWSVRTNVPPRWLLAATERSFRQTDKLSPLIAACVRSSLTTTGQHVLVEADCERRCESPLCRPSFAHFGSSNARRWWN